jgi:dTDP-4-amino-4,6-dideoxygalactose transaminase
VFADAGYKRGLCPVAERAYSELVSLPLYADLTDSEQDRVVDTLRGVLSG